MIFHMILTHSLTEQVVKHIRFCEDWLHSWGSQEKPSVRLPYSSYIIYADALLD